MFKIFALTCNDLQVGTIVKVSQSTNQLPLVYGHIIVNEVHKNILFMVTFVLNVGTSESILVSCKSNIITILKNSSYSYIYLNANEVNNMTISDALIRTLHKYKK